VTDRVVELRQYTLHPGRRDALVRLFDQHLVESQEAAGMDVIGQFRDLDDPDRFVWLRGFPDLTSRHRALSDFYGGAAWAEHSEAANATMVDFDDVLLLRALAPGSGVPAGEVARPPVDSAPGPPSVVTATVYRLVGPVTPAVLELVLDVLEPQLRCRGVGNHGLLQTEPGPNTFPSLPVREGENVVVRLARFDDLDSRAAVLRDLGASSAWQSGQRQLAAHLLAPALELRLAPTARSLLR
jgi:hypothetical protein